MHPILFLDVDGVLNARECWQSLAAQRHRIDRARVALLNDVVAKSDCRTVVSSTWRLDFECRGILRAYGLAGEFHHDWRTPELAPPRAADAAGVLRWSVENPHVRGREIRDWLWRHGRPPFAIVDDDDDMLPEQRHRLVLTSFETGLTREHADRLTTLLTMETDHAG